MHGFVIIREPRSGCGRARFKTVSIHPIVSSFAAVINSRQSVCNLLSIPYISNSNTCILDFFWLIDFLPFISRKFYETIILSCNFTTSEGKKTLMKHCTVFTTSAIHVYFASLTLTYPLISQMPAFLGIQVILTSHF